MSMCMMDWSSAWDIEIECGADPALAHRDQQDPLFPNLSHEGHDVLDVE